MAWAALRRLPSASSKNTRRPSLTAATKTACFLSFVLARTSARAASISSSSLMDVGFCLSLILQRYYCGNADAILRYLKDIGVGFSWVIDPADLGVFLRKAVQGLLHDIAQTFMEVIDGGLHDVELLIQGSKRVRLWLPQ